MQYNVPTALAVCNAYFKAMNQKFQVQNQAHAKRESQLKARICELELDLEGFLG